MLFFNLTKLQINANLELIKLKKMSKVIIYETKEVKHCSNCSASVATQNKECPLICTNVKARKAYPRSAGGDKCGKRCKFFVSLRALGEN